MGNLNPSESSSIGIAAPTLAEKIQCTDTRSKLPFDICQFPYCEQARLYLIWKMITQMKMTYAFYLDVFKTKEFDPKRNIL